MKSVKKINLTSLRPKKRFLEVERQVWRFWRGSGGCSRQLEGQWQLCVPLEAVLCSDEGFGRKYGGLKFGKLENYTGIDEQKRQRSEDWGRFRGRISWESGCKVRIMSMWSFFGVCRGSGACFRRIY